MHTSHFYSFTAATLKAMVVCFSTLATLCTRQVGVFEQSKDNF